MEEDRSPGADERLALQRELARQAREILAERREREEAEAALSLQSEAAEERAVTLSGCYQPVTVSTDPEKSDRRPLNWRALSAQDAPERFWAVEHWLPMSAVTLMTGGAGVGKSLVAQALGSSLALRREYLDWSPQPLRVLMWACEDDHDELWRRQLAIARWLEVPLEEFDGQFILESYDSREVELARLIDNHLTPTPALAELREQIGDYKADFVILDNVARLYAGNENDRHQVTSFVAMLGAAASPRRAAVLLLGHPSKQAGSEYSGSTAWEAAVRARLYLGRKLPDQDDTTDEEAPENEEVRYLCRRKSNYSARDYRKVRYIDGVMVPEIAVGERLSAPPKPDSEYSRMVVRDAILTLKRAGLYATASTASSLYLPKLAEQYKLLNGHSRPSLAATLRAMLMSGEVKMAPVGAYPNRTARLGLVLADCTNGLHK
jgi:AAA domain